MTRRSLFTLLLLLCAVAGLPLARAAPPPVAAARPAADAPGLDVVSAAYNDLLDLFYRPLAPVALLTAGWDDLGAAQRRAGRPAPPPLADLPAGREAAFAAFSESYANYVAALPAGLEADAVAFQIGAGMARSVNERHTAFLTPAAYSASVRARGGDELPVGVGLRLTANGPWIVRELAPGGPAETAGVRVGDVIVAVDGRELTTMTAAQLAQGNDGPAGATVALSLEREDGRTEISVTRAAYYFPALTGRLLAGGVGYLRLSNFVQSGAPLPSGAKILDDLDARLDDFDQAGATSLVLDLRGNGGGSVLTTLELLGRFLPEDTLAALRFDERGHQTAFIVSGQMRRRQLPLAVLVDGGSASASELTASTLKEAGRAVLVGRRTAGAFANNLILPLPQGAGLSVAFAQIVTAGAHARIDDVGFPVDVEVADTRTAADYRAGRDPQLDAAVVALATAPPPPTFAAATTGLSRDQIEEELAPYLPDAAQIPQTARLSAVKRTGDRATNHVNEANIASARDPLALQQTLRERGWLGSYSRGYGPSLLGLPSLGVSAELYATAAGAAAALAANDAPDLLQQFASPLQLGDGAVAYRGVWAALGSVGLSWRRGRVVFSVTYSDQPGREDRDTVLAVARQVDAVYDARPSPAAAVAPVATLARQVWRRLQRAA